MRPRRVVVEGVSGVGKTTLAGRIGEVAGIPHTEIDALFHGPSWTPRPEFLDDVQALVASEAWVTEWQYSAARSLLTARADLLVWLDLPFATVTLPRVIARTLRRRPGREQLWNGNIEPPLHTFFTDPEHIVRWSISTRNNYRERIPAVPADLPVVRLRTVREVESGWPARSRMPRADGPRSTVSVGPHRTVARRQRAKLLSFVDARGRSRRSAARDGRKSGVSLGPAHRCGSETSRGAAAESRITSTGEAGGAAASPSTAATAYSASPWTSRRTVLSAGV